MPDNSNMQNWPDRRLLELLKIEIPIVQAPMAGSDSVVSQVRKTIMKRKN